MVDLEHRGKYVRGLLLLHVLCKEAISVPRTAKLVWDLCQAMDDEEFVNAYVTASMVQSMRGAAKRTIQSPTDTALDETCTILERVIY
jgi:hypothetical protein